MLLCCIFVSNIVHFHNVNYPSFEQKSLKHWTPNVTHRATNILELISINVKRNSQFTQFEIRLHCIQTKLHKMKIAFGFRLYLVSECEKHWKLRWMQNVNMCLQFNRQCSFSIIIIIVIVCEWDVFCNGNWEKCTKYTHLWPTFSSLRLGWLGF